MHELKSSLLGGSGGSSIPWELLVDIGESLELVLVQVLNHFLIRRGQHRRVAREKTVKVLGLPSTLLRKVGWGWSSGDGAEREGEGEELERRGMERWLGYEGRKGKQKKGNGGLNQGVR